MVPLPRVSESVYLLFVAFGTAQGKGDDLGTSEPLATVFTTSAALREAPDREMSMDMEGLCGKDETDSEGEGVDDGLFLMDNPIQARLRVSLARGTVLSETIGAFTSLMGCEPYARQHFCFETVSGPLVTCEDLFIPRTAVSVPRAFLDLIIQERQLLVSDIKYQIREVLGNTAAPAVAEGSGGSSSGASTSKSSPINPLLHVVQDIQSLVVDAYVDIRNHCDWCLEVGWFWGPDGGCIAC
jgi:hypothetical protein